MDSTQSAPVSRKERPMPPDDEHDDDGMDSSPPSGPIARSGEKRAFFQQYKPEQGRWTRMGTVIGGGALSAWGALFLYDHLQVYEGDEGWRLFITIGLPLVFATALFALSWWFAFVSQGTSDFMIATEGEMKKVSWSTKREIVGSTKVVILFTVFLAVFLFVVDIVFQAFFSWIGVLKL